MNENQMKSLEEQLRSWRPRRPSATLKWRLFLPSSRNTAARWLGWLTPTAACAWLALLSLNSGGGIPGPSRSSPMMAMNSNNLSYATSWQGFAQRGENAPVPAIFKWTNTGSSTFTIGLAPSRKVN